MAGWEDVTPSQPASTNPDAGWQDVEPTGPQQTADSGFSIADYINKTKENTRNFLAGFAGNTTDETSSVQQQQGAQLADTMSTGWIAQAIHSLARPASPGQEDIIEKTQGREALMKQRLRSSLGEDAAGIVGAFQSLGAAIEDPTSPGMNAIDHLVDAVTPDNGFTGDKRQHANMAEKVAGGVMNLAGGFATDPLSVVPFGGSAEAAADVGKATLKSAILKKASQDVIKSTPVVGSISAFESAQNQQATQGYVDPSQVASDMMTGIAQTSLLVAGHSVLTSVRAAKAAVDASPKEAGQPKGDLNSVLKEINGEGWGEPTEPQSVPAAKEAPAPAYDVVQSASPDTYIGETPNVRSMPYEPEVQAMQDALDQRGISTRGIDVEDWGKSGRVQVEEPDVENVTISDKRRAPVGRYEKVDKSTPQIVLAGDYAQYMSDALSTGTKSPEFPLDNISELQGIEDAQKDAEVQSDLSGKMFSPLEEAQIREGGPETFQDPTGISSDLREAITQHYNNFADAIERGWGAMRQDTREGLAADYGVEPDKDAVINAIRARGQAGAITPKQFAMLGLGAAGAAVGYAQTGSPWGMIGGAAVGSVAGFLALSGLEAAAETAGGMFRRTDAREATAVTLEQDSQHTLAQRKFGVQLRRNLKSALTQSEQDRLLLYAHHDPSITPTPREEATHRTVQDKILKPMGQGSVDRGLIKGMVEDFMPRNWKATDKTPPDLKEAMESGDFSKLSSKTRARTEHMLSRTLANGWDGFLYAKEHLGLEQKYGYVDSIANYAEATAKAHATYDMYKDMMDSGLIRDEKSRGDKAIPADYVKKMGNLANPRQTYYASPEVMDRLDHLFAKQDSSGFWRGYDLANQTAKRSVLFGTGFHIGTLIKRHLYLRNGLGDMDINPRELVQIVSGTHPDVEKFWNAPEGSMPSMIHEEGLKLSNPEDANTDNFYKSLGQFKDLADQFSIPGKAVGGLAGLAAQASHKVDEYTFANTMNGFKILDSMWLAEKIQAKNLADVQAGKRTMMGMGRPVRLLADREIARAVASSMNDVYGGQHWYRMALEAKTELGRSFKLKAFSPRGRQQLQRAILAPDWTISNTRSLLKSINYYGDADIASIHRMFTRRALFTYFAIGNLINYATTGHSMFSNDNPLLVSISPDRNMQLDKSVGEVLNWFRDPKQEALNKMAVPPKALMEDFFNRKYLTPDMGAPRVYNPKDPFLTKIGKGFVHGAADAAPIPGQQLYQEGLGPAAASFASFPTYKKPKKKE